MGGDTTITAVLCSESHITKNDIEDADEDAT